MDETGDAASVLTPHAFATLLKASLTERPTGIVLAVSGGPDSICLMGLCAALNAGGGWPPFTVATVDHGLRAEARSEALFVEAQARAVGLPVHLLAWTGPKPSRALQEKAREARYGLLTTLCRTIGASHLVTAHTLDDQAETVLFRLARGTGMAGLAGMAVRTDRNGVVHLRPLLTISKARLIATCAQAGWAFRDDPSNRDPRFARSRMRALLPALAVEGLTADRLAMLAGRAARAEAALRQAADELCRTCDLDCPPACVRFDGRRLAAAPRDLMIRVLGRAVERMAGRPNRLERLERLVEAVSAALDRGVALRRTLGGALVTVSGDGVIALAPEQRRRGVNAEAKSPAPRQIAPVNHDRCPSLGKGGREPYIAS